MISVCYKTALKINLSKVFTLQFAKKANFIFACVLIFVCLLTLHLTTLASIFDLDSDIDLKEQYRLVELKKMLSQYGMRSFHVSYAARAKVK